MIGINYRYQLNEKKGTIKLAPTKSMWVAILASYLFSGAFFMAAARSSKPVVVVETDTNPENNQEF